MKEKIRLERRNDWAIIFLVMLIVCISCLIICPEKSTEDIFNQNIYKTVEVKVATGTNEYAYGTGTLIDSNGAILTNRHMVFFDGAVSQDIQVRFANEEEYLPATFIKYSETDDLAIIKIEKKTQPFLLSEKYSVGQRVYTIGNPSNFGLTFAEGLISSGIKKVVYDGQERNVLQTSLVVNEGNSGGPVFDESGYLLGIVSFRVKDDKGDVIQGVTFIVPASVILNFLNSSIDNS